MTMQLIGWALIHSFWEGGAIAAVLAIVFSATRHRAPSVRYALGMIGLAMMVAVPLATAARMNTTEPVATTAAPVEPGLSPSITAKTSNIPGADQPVFGDVGRRSIQRIPGVPRPMITRIEPAFPWIVAAWAIGLVLLSIRMIGGVARTRRITRDGTTPASDRVDRILSQISRELGISRAIRALEGTRVTVPVVIGWMRPVIVLPASLVSGLTASQLEMLLAHELAHIRRYDFLANMLQTVIETLLFFHPAAWWLSDRIREERENCCDDIAVAVCGGDRQGYTAALLALEESRDEGIVFAAAATGGGTLFRRAMRLMKGGPAHVDLGARWIAGVITIFAAFFTTGPAIGKAANIPMVSPLEVMAFLSPAADSASRSTKERTDFTRSDPDTVLRYSGSGSFNERWQWAEQRARSLGSSTYWIGYLVAGDPSGNMIYSSEMPVRSGMSTFSGKLRFSQGSNLEFTGVSLAPLVGNHAPTSLAIFIQFERGNSNDAVRVHVGSFSLPMYFGGGPALWLDSATDQESVAKLRSLVATTRALGKQRDLVAAVGVHRDVSVTLSPLVQWLESRSESEGIRREAAEALGDVADPRALAALAHAARNDSDTRVRRDAIEAIGSMRISAAVDTLMAFATNLEPSDLRRDAIEQLSDRHEPRVVAFLRNLALGNNDSDVQRQALESLGDMHEEGFAAVVEIARRAPDADTRRRAVETIADAQPADRSVEFLAQVIRNDPSETVRVKAVEALSDVRDDRANALLRDLVTNSNDPTIQIKATEALGETARSDNDVRALVSVAKTHPAYDVRRKAIEALGEARSPSAVAALRAIAVGDESEGLRRAAMEAYADKVDGSVSVEFLKSIIANDPSERMRMSALDILSELRSDAGIAAVREIARSSADSRIRRQAV